jgi:hypothetical protein
MMLVVVLVSFVASATGIAAWQKQIFLHLMYSSILQ